MLIVAGGMASHSKTFLDSTEVSFSKFREPKGSDILELLLFLDTQVSLAPTHVSWLVGCLVGKLVGHTFGFPISGQ